MEQLGFDEGLKELLLGIFCDIDDFCNAFEDYWHNHLVADGTKMMPKSAMSLSEIMAIVVFFRKYGMKLGRRISRTDSSTP